MGTFSIIASLLAQAPKIIELVSDTVQAVEKLFGSGNGSAKKEAATQAVSDAFNIFGTVAPVAGLNTAGSSEVQAALSNLIDATVAFYNAIGVFKRNVTQ